MDTALFQPDWLAGNAIIMIKALFLLMTADIICGLIVAFIRKALNSTVSWRGMGKKTTTFIVVLVVAILQSFAQFPTITIFAYEMSMLEGVILFYCVWEAISVMEKAAMLGVPMPKTLIEALEKVRGVEAPPLTVAVVRDKTDEPKP